MIFLILKKKDHNLSLLEKLDLFLIIGLFWSNFLGHVVHSKALVVACSWWTCFSCVCGIVFHFTMLSKEELHTRTIQNWISTAAATLRCCRYRAPLIVLQVKECLKSAHFVSFSPKGVSYLSNHLYCWKDLAKRCFDSFLKNQRSS